jgi:hypothetical protein
LTYISGCNPYSSFAVVSAVRMVAASDRSNYIDIYFNSDDPNIVSVEVQTMHGIFEKVAFTPVGEETARSYITLPQSSFTMTKLWENASPQSDFVEQTISLPQIHNYDFVFVTASTSAAAANQGNYMSVVYFPTTIGASAAISSVGCSGEEVWGHCRYASIVDGGIHFSAGHQYRVLYKVYPNWNNRAVPIAVYGVKGVR